MRAFLPLVTMITLAAIPAACMAPAASPSPPARSPSIKLPPVEKATPTPLPVEVDWSQVEIISTLDTTEGGIPSLMPLDIFYRYKGGEERHVVVVGGLYNEEYVKKAITRDIWLQQQVEEMRKGLEKQTDEFIKSLPTPGWERSQPPKRY